MKWNRRRFLQGAGAAFAAGTAVAGVPRVVTPQATLGAGSGLSCITTTAGTPWQVQPLASPGWRWDALNLNVDLSATAQTMEGFGGCFNERGWSSLSKLGNDDCESVLRELFDPVAGARFSLCRMPIGANDFALKAYSYDEVKDDFELKHFSIDNDKATLIPFIHAAQRYQPKLRVWASPWSPPSWMKKNGFYAEAAGRAGQKDNGIRPDQIGHEGEDMFILEEPYLRAYAKYFGRFIDAYQAEGIRVGMVMPQNEFNSAQNFPSCTWTPEGLAKFIRYLGPEMSSRDVAVFFGTLERGDPQMLRTVTEDTEAGKYIKGVGVQWAGKNALPTIHREFPKLALYQSEQECGDGSNKWEYTAYCWQLMKHYVRSGASAYMYWNISVDQGGLSTWGWAQNALVSVDEAKKGFRYNHDYYLMKHLSHFVEVGAKCVETSGTCDDALGFVNPDGALVVLLRNAAPHDQFVDIRGGGRVATVKLLADSISTVVMKA
ncbi:MAG TPA: glycoside hydrolase family 30 beta sandwich domain-containing protein [Edaphobacter sp.]|nr:glycoside hydrolase family 30 beta sandwich domain-containing protein [Edaphobacter sp.]